MSNDKLHDLAVISIHRSRAKNVDMKNVIDRFAQLYPNSRIALY